MISNLIIVATNYFLSLVLIYEFKPFTYFVIIKGIRMNLFPNLC